MGSKYIPDAPCVKPGIMHARRKSKVVSGTKQMQKKWVLVCGSCVSKDSLFKGNAMKPSQEKWPPYLIDIMTPHHSQTEMHGRQASSLEEEAGSISRNA
eukprot:1162128-Pelagomonas_calceolata.AAC.3